jgi:hypothetical protein
MNEEFENEALEGVENPEATLDVEESGATDSRADTENEAHSDEEYYGELIENDLHLLRESFSELKDIRNIEELCDPMRFARLRDRGLSAVEAYIEITKPKKAFDNRSHLRSSMPAVRTSERNSMSRAELEMARELFPEVSDAEIQKLYKSVTR